MARWKSEGAPEPPIWSYFVVEEADLQDVLHVLHSVGHVQIPQRVSQQEHVGTRPQLLEVACVEQRALSLVVDVDQLSLEGLEQTLRTDTSRVKHADSVVKREVQIHMVAPRVGRSQSRQSPCSWR